MKQTKSILVIVLALAVGNTARAQEFGRVFEGGIQDAEAYFQEYTKPLMLSFNNGLGSGWYNTAKPHKLLGFDLTMTLNVANIPSDDRQFVFDPSKYSNIEVIGSNNTLPTAVGGETNIQLRAVPGRTISNGSQSITYTDEEIFDAPDGFDVEDLPVVGFPVPALQLGIGLPKNTDLKIRYASDFGTIEDGSFNIFGIGVMHDLKQWVPGLKQSPFDFSGFIGFTTLSADFGIQDGSASDEYQADGSVEMKVSSLTIQGVVSKKIAIFTPYAGIGYNVSGSSFDVLGNFTYRQNGEVVTFVDPLSLEFDGGSSPRINLGMRIKLLVLTLHAEYAIQKYNVFTLGAGLSIR
ncbi:MAG: hypothetical protein Tsb0034_26160 [Ekhidna sp.]